jgi:putative DNA methylase
MLTFRRRRRLPHFDVDHATYFVTACLAGSVPARGGFKHEDRGAFAVSEEWLDTKTTVRLLADRRLARVVRDEIRRGAGIHYELHAYVVMASHIHLVFTPNAGWSRPVIMNALKGRSSRACNALLQRRGAFWQSESFDRVVRDAREFEQFVNYVEFNPVKAGLCTRPEEWECSSARHVGLVG